MGNGNKEYKIVGRWEALPLFLLSLGTEITQIFQTPPNAPFSTFWTKKVPNLWSRCIQLMHSAFHSGWQTGVVPWVLMTLPSQTQSGCDKNNKAPRKIRGAVAFVVFARSCWKVDLWEGCLKSKRHRQVVIKRAVCYHRWIPNHRESLPCTTDCLF